MQLTHMPVHIIQMYINFSICYVALLPRHMLAIKGPTGFSSSSTADQVAANWNGTGKTVIITGATGGLGGETTRVLASKGAEVVLAVRDITRGEALAKVGGSHQICCWQHLSWGCMYQGVT